MDAMSEDKVETPTQAKTEAKILKVEDGKATVEAANHRIIVVSKIGALDYYRLTKALGASASNPATMDLAMMVAGVKEIDGQLLSHTRENHIEHTLKMLGFDGLAAVGEGLKALSEQTQDGIEAAKN